MTQLPTPADIARDLVRIRTVNPPGDEAEAQKYLSNLIESAGLAIETFEKVRGRPNLVARLPGIGRRAPLIYHGHLDVVGVDDQDWDLTPFAGHLVDGELHGRGTLDMKSGVAMLTHALLRAAGEGVRPKGDVLLALVTDSETGGDTGLGYLLDRHPEVFAGARYAIGEFGGFPLHAFGRRFYRIGVSQKQYAHLRVRLKGSGGHGSQPATGTVMGHLGAFLHRLDVGRLPYHLSAISQQVIESIAAAVPPRSAAVMRRLLDEETFEQAVAELGPLATTFESLFRDTANPTIVTAGVKFNVIPSEASIHVDVRLLPGRTVDQVKADLLSLTENAEIDVLAVGPAAPDTFNANDLFGTLGAIITDLDQEAIPIPYLFNESPDGRLFADHGIQHFGFLPMNLPPEIDLPSLIHAPNERVPIGAIDFGAEALYRLIARY